MADTYKIVRYYQDKPKRTMYRGFTLEKAQAWCEDPETSSETCKGQSMRAVTRRNGPWFEGYEKE